ncbi:MAG: GPW/gp25 family protein [Brucella anthropi]
MADDVGFGVDRITGKPLGRWPHVEQSLQVIFTTAFSSRVMRRWFGSLIPALLGENIHPSVVLRLMVSIYAALEFEPRFALTQIHVASPADELRQGRLRLILEGQYRPRGHLGDFTVEGAKRVQVEAGTGGFLSLATV